MIKKGNFAIIITLILIILLAITTPIQAVTLGQVYNLKSETIGDTVYFSWSSVTNADGYDLYINISNRGYQYIGSVTSTNASVIGFQTNKTYTAKVCAYRVNSNGVKEAGTFSSPITVNFKESTTLAKVETLNVSQNGGLISLNWSKVPNATGYEIFANAPGQDFTNLGTVVGTNNAFVSGAINGNTYYFKVRAYKTLSSGAIEYGEFSPERGIHINNTQYDDEPSIQPEENKPEQVTNLYINSISENEVKINWNRVNDAEAYEIYLAKENGTFHYLNTVYNNYATLKNLDYNTTYRVKVRAYKYVNNYIKYGSFSSIKTFTTKDYTLEKQVTGLKISNVGQERATISWNKISGVDGYNIYLSTNNTRNFKLIKTTTARSATLKNLDYATTYYVKVCAYKFINGKEIEGVASVCKQFTTERASEPEENKNVPKVKNLSARVVGGTVTLNWNKVAGAVKYEISFTVPGIGGDTKFVTNTNSKVISGLTNKEYAYTAKVRAYKYVNGKLVAGPYSNVSRFKAK